MSSRFSNIKYYINSNKRLFASITLFGIGVSIAYYIYGPNSASENITKANKTEKKKETKKEEIKKVEFKVKDKKVEIKDEDEKADIKDEAKKVEIPKEDKKVCIKDDTKEVEIKVEDKKVEVKSEDIKIVQDETEQNIDVINTKPVALVNVPQDLDTAVDSSESTGDSIITVTKQDLSIDIQSSEGQASGTVSPVLSDNGFERVYLPKINQTPTHDENVENAAVTLSEYAKPDPTSSE